jgi:hypothetical protein
LASIPSMGLTHIPERDPKFVHASRIRSSASRLSEAVWNT